MTGPVEPAGSRRPAAARAWRRSGSSRGWRCAWRRAMRGARTPRAARRRSRASRREGRTTGPRCARRARPARGGARSERRASAPCGRQHTSVSKAPASSRAASASGDDHGRQRAAARASSPAASRPRRTPGVLARAERHERDAGVAERQPHELLARSSRSRPAPRRARGRAAGVAEVGWRRAGLRRPARACPPARGRGRSLPRAGTAAGQGVEVSLERAGAGVVLQDARARCRRPPPSPRSRCEPGRSIARATPLAWPGGVRTTTRFWATRTSFTNALRSSIWRWRSSVSVGGPGSSYTVPPGRVGRCGSRPGCAGRARASPA